MRLYATYLGNAKPFAFPVGQVMLLLTILIFCISLILATITEAAFNTTILLACESAIGLILCRKTEVRLQDPRLRVLGYFWLFKVALTLVLVCGAWMPQLDPASSTWGYDPQRFYYLAKELLDNNWRVNLLSLNYVGVLYYYGAIYRVFGYNPAIPALVNAFVTLVASLYLIETAYLFKVERQRRDWTIAFVLLLPEVLWFDVLTSRETLVGALLIFAMLSVGRELTLSAKWFRARTVLLSSISVLALAVIRTSMVLPVIVTFALMVFLANPSGKPRLWVKIALLGGAAVLLVLTIVITGYSSASRFDPVATFVGQLSTSGNIAESTAMQWSQNSVGMLLFPNNLWQAIVFVPPRMVLYLVAPLPNTVVSLGNLLAGNWSDWQRLFSLLSSYLNVLMVPLALASLVHSVKTRRSSAGALVLNIAFWTTFVAIVAGNFIIQERYRVMAAPMLFACAWLGARTSPRQLIMTSFVLWFGLLVIGAICMFAYKGVL